MLAFIYVQVAEVEIAWGRAGSFVRVAFDIRSETELQGFYRVVGSISDP